MPGSAAAQRAKQNSQAQMNSTFLRSDVPRQKHPSSAPDRLRARQVAVETGAFLLLCGLPVAFVIPALLIWAADGRLALGLGRARYLGIAPMIGGAAVYVVAAAQLAATGKGMPAPLDPTRELVASGAYSIVRNPMYLAAALFFWGEVVLFDSAVLAAYALLMMSAYLAGVIWLEEPALARRFGAPYAEYCARVPRWMPSIRQARKRRRTPNTN
jgi:protein-S-isoprenylcysteine O-methyltransferase Ste14